MVQLPRETSNRLFQVLGEWNAILHGSPLYVTSPQIESNALNQQGF